MDQTLKVTRAFRVNLALVHKSMSRHNTPLNDHRKGQSGFPAEDTL
jgi:hypothetical protein